MPLGHADSPGSSARDTTVAGFDGVVGGNASCMADGDIHVVKKGADWIVTIEGIKGDLVSYDTEDEALRSARRVAEAARSDVVLDDELRLGDSATV